MLRPLSSLLLLLALPVAAQDFTIYRGHGGPVMALLTMRDGRLASASFDNSVGLWSGDTPHWLEGHDAAVTALTEDASGQLVSGGDDFAVRHWTDPPLKIGEHKGKVTSLALSAEGDRVASGSWDGDIVLWSLRGEAPQTLASPGAGVNAVAFNAAGSLLYAATSAGDLLVYDMAERGPPRPVARHGFGINRLVADEGWIAYGAVDGGTRVINAETGAQIADFSLDRRPILSMSYHRETAQLAVGDGQGFIMVIDTMNWQITRDFRAMRTGPVWALAYSPDGQMLHAGGLDEVIYAWPAALLDRYDPAAGESRSFLRAVESMGNGERQFMRKCSICHSLEPGPSRKAGPTLHGVFGRQAGSLEGYRYSQVLENAPIVWDNDTIDDLFETGPEHFVPGSKMPMQVIAKSQDRADLIAYLHKQTTE